MQKEQEQRFKSISIRVTADDPLTVNLALDALRKSFHLVQIEGIKPNTIDNVGSWRGYATCEIEVKGDEGL